MALHSDETAELEAFIAALDPRPAPPPPAVDFERARRIAQLLRNTGARPDIVAAFDRAADACGLPATIARDLHG